MHPITLCLENKIKRGGGRGQVPDLYLLLDNFETFFDRLELVRILCDHYDIEVGGGHLHLGHIELVQEKIFEACNKQAVKGTLKMLNRDIKRGRMETFNYSSIRSRCPGRLQNDQLIEVLCTRFDIALTPEIKNNFSKIDPFLLQAFYREHALYVEKRMRNCNIFW